MRAALFAFLQLLAGASQAGGPWEVCSDKTPVVFNPPAIELNHDRGNLGMHSKAQADALMERAAAIWTNAGTASIRIGRGADLPEDVTAANVLTYHGDLVHTGPFLDGLNPVIYDDDGSIIDALAGVGQHAFVRGFSGSYYDGTPPCRYLEAQLVINGNPSPAWTDDSLTLFMAHELGHVIGLDHTQLDDAQGLVPANYPLMYPLALRTGVSLHEDDIAALSALYPDVSRSAAYGQVSGTLVMADGATPVRGANIWATEVTTGRVYSVVSDYLTHGNGYFKLLLPEGTYQLHAGAIKAGFAYQNSVGPYAGRGSQQGVPASFSFQAPLYVNGAPMAPVTLGNASPVRFTILPGCAATVTFRLDGAGTVGGNCASGTWLLSPPEGSTLAGASQTFTWRGTGSVYAITVGSATGAWDYGVQYSLANTATVSGLPVDGRALFVRLYTQMANGDFLTSDYTFHAYRNPALQVGALLNPADAGTFTSPRQAFTWSGVATAYLIIAGTAPGGWDLGAAVTLQNTATLSGFPMDGRTIYVRLYSLIDGVFYWRDYSFATLDGTMTPAAITNPPNGTWLHGASQVITWTDAMASLYLVWVGNAPGTNDLGTFPSEGTTSTSTTITGLPMDGRTFFVRVWSFFGSTVLATDYAYRSIP